MIQGKSLGSRVFNVFNTILMIVLTLSCLYPLSKPSSEYRPKNVIMWIVVFCMLFNGGTIPWYITMVNYGMIDSMIGLILCGGVPVFNLILLINFYRGLPRELMEAGPDRRRRGLDHSFSGW